MERIHLPSSAVIREVCPRDGFQSVKEFIPTEKKIEYIEGMIETGIQEIEITSFVSPKAIPQLADASEVLGEVKRRHRDVSLTVLVPNLKGAEKALEHGADVLNYVFSASESHNRANINRTVDQSLAELDNILLLAGSDAEVSVSIATSFMCPFEGRMDPAKVSALVRLIREKGVHSLCLAETIGTCLPTDFSETLRAVQPVLEGVIPYLHIHDTYGFALLNVQVALNLGFNRFDSAIGGLGGCPFAPGAAGNVATEDLVYFLNGIGVRTGLDAHSIVRMARALKRDGFATLGHLAGSSFGRKREEGECA